MNVSQKKNRVRFRTFGTNGGIKSLTGPFFPITRIHYGRPVKMGRNQRVDRIGIGGGYQQKIPFSCRTEIVDNLTVFSAVTVGVVVGQRIRFIPALQIGVQAAVFTSFSVERDGMFRQIERKDPERLIGT